MAKKRVIKEKKKDDRILFAFLATFLSIIGFVIALAAKKQDKYVMFYAKQSLVIFIIGAVAGVLGMILGVIPIMGWIIHFALNIVIFILWLLSWIYALSGEQKAVPVVGEWGKKFNF